MTMPHSAKFIIEQVDKVPPKEEISAVFAFVLNEAGQLLVTKNERGWDIPGGHREEDEVPEDALVREVLEETSTKIENIRLTYSVSFAQKPNSKKMLFYTATLDKVLPFQKSDDVLEREFVLPAELMKIYGGGEPELLINLLQRINLLYPYE